MTDETDHSDADSGRSDEAKQEAEVRATSGPESDPDVFLVEYPDGSVEYEPGTPRNQALFGEGLYSEIDGTSAHDYQGVPVEVVADVSSDDYLIIVDGAEARVPSDQIAGVVEAFDSPFTGEKLHDLYCDITEGQVRYHVVDAFLDRFPEDRVQETPDGWVIDETFVVTYDAENFLVDVDPIDPYGNDIDDSKQAVYLDIDADGERSMVAPDGERYSLTEVEQEFLVTVEGLVYPENYFGAELVDEIEQHKADGDMFGDAIEDLAEQSKVTGFTDSRSGIHHGSKDHDFDKHRLSDLNVTDEVSDLLWAHDYDHAGPWELQMRKDELINRPDIDVFEDAPDDDPGKWDKIESTKENAPIPPGVKDTLEKMYGE